VTIQEAVALAARWVITASVFLAIVLSVGHA
jgi:hypothetical protein